MCFTFREIHGKESDESSRVHISDNFQIIQLNWVRISGTSGKTGFEQNKNQ